MSRQPPVARVGDYHVLDFVGAGGMGEVFRAVHSRSGQVAAVKFLTAGGDLSPEARARWRNRFIHEARVQESLRHPHLAAFCEWHEIGQMPCIVMELVDGYTLNDRLQQGAMPSAEALSVFTQVVEAVAFMHSRGIIHRDIKSGNIKVNSRGEVKLLDFGIAKTNDMARLTATGAFVGTLQYLSPEQIKGKEADARCDVWALGALFYEMLSGSPPFEAPTWGELIEKVTKAHFEPLAARCSDLPSGFDTVVRRCLQKQPTARFADASELLAALHQLAKNPAGVKDASNIQRKPVSYIPFFVAGGVGVVLLMVWLVSLSSLGRSEGPLAPTPVPTTAAVTSPTRSGPDIQPLNDPVQGENESKTITIDVFEGADQTQVYSNDQLLGHPPSQLTGRLGEQFEIRLSRPGFQTRRAQITISSGRSYFTFSLDPS